MTKEQQNLYKKGSEWRRWDLHVHAPSKYTCAKKDDFTGVNLKEKQENFIEELQSLKNVSVVGITDYFSLNGYKKVIEQKDDIKNIDLILPNIELRLSPETADGKKINIHIIPNSTVLKIEDIENFLFKFEFKQQGATHTCKEESLVSLGKKLDSSLGDEAAFKKGLNGFSVTYQEFFRVFNLQDEHFKQNILIGVSNNSTDGASGIKDLVGIRNMIYEGVDFIFSAQPSDRKYFLGQSLSDSAEDIILKYNSLKPCVHGSDYHGSKTGKKICSPDLNRFCWIKADPTFEGIKQIIYEPKDRVKIQELKPEEKNDYDVIDSVRFTDDSFISDEIFINQNLTTIIGGKSTGKSILLREVARTIAPSEVEQKLKKVKIVDYPGDMIGNFTVSWRDGREDKKSEEKENRRIIYIPQSYLNRLTDDAEKSGPIDKMIEDVLRQDSDVEFVLSKLQDENREVEQNITQNIEGLFYKGNDIKTLTDNIKKRGDKKGIELEIEKLKQEISELKVKAGMTSPEIKDYNDLLEKISGLKKEQEEKLKDLKLLDILKSQKNLSIFLESKNMLSEISANIQEVLNKNLDSILENAEME